MISGDSRQVYRHMDIGTGKDLDEYIVDGQAVPFHLIDIVDAGCRYNVYEYCRDFRSAYADICARRRLPILCGGSGLYIEAAVGGYAMPPAPENPALRSLLDGQSTAELVQKLKDLHQLHRIRDPQNRRRLVRAIEAALQAPPSAPSAAVPLPNVYAAVVWDREARRRRITERLAQRLRSGMVEEVQALMERGVAPETLYYYGLEYRFIALYLMRQLTYPQMTERLETAIHQFAKRQMTWFRGMERRGAVIHQIDGCLPLAQKVEAIKEIYLRAS